ncbi:MAG: Crp/Fnr family transcriptional regulator [Defluviitaleaceae bacterium]|nr:Crp/Fnr family transcriptional regulator [Defluviitaleaceae bacterium]
MTDLFHGIAETDLPRLLKCINARTVHYKKDELIIEEGSVATEFGIVVSGQARSIKWDLSGRLIILTFIEQNSVIGVMVAAREGHISPVSVQATTDSTITLISFERLLARCKGNCAGHEQLLRNYINAVADKGLELHERINCLLKPTVRDKILTFLQRTSKEQQSSSFTIPMNRNVMAEYLNVDRAALSRELSRMKKEGLIDYHKNWFYFE